jgi:SAM-dependent methyltransferase
MRHVLARRPIPSFEDYSSSHIRAGKAYHKRFKRNRGRALMWEFEQVFLRRLLSESQPRHVLDFACGTGRISGFVGNLLPSSTVYGIDISESMLDIARQESSKPQFLHMESHAAIPFFGERHFDLILAFRFFANADRKLASSVSEDLCRLLSDQGILVVNNHRNFWSLSYLGQRLMGEQPLGALNPEIEELFTKQGLHVRQRVSLGVWPQTDKKPALMPWSVVARVERANLAQCAAYHTLGYNTIWVLSRQK